MNLTDCILTRLDPSDNLTNFSCGDSDLEDFLQNDAINYQNELLAVTYLFLNNNDRLEIVAFFSVTNDKLTDDGTITIWNRLSRRIPNYKRRKQYPSVLLARLGVDSKYQGFGIGANIIQFIKGWFTIKNKTGCRFLVIDAYNKDSVINFYSKNGFDFLTIHDVNSTTRHMYYDLMRFTPV